MKKRASCVIILLSCLLHRMPAEAAADPAEMLIREGVELRKRGQDAKAVERFQEAYELAHTPRAAAQLGLCEQALGRYVEADAHISEALLSSDPWIERSRSTLETSLEGVRRHLATITVTGEPSGAVIRVNGQAAGRLPQSIPVRVLPGAVEIIVSAMGHETHKATVQGKAGETHIERVTLVTQQVRAEAMASRNTPNSDEFRSPVVSETRSSEPNSHRALRVTSYVTLGLSLVGLGVGIQGHVQREGAAGDFAAPANGCDMDAILLESPQWPQHTLWRAVAWATCYCDSAMGLSRGSWALSLGPRFGLAREGADSPPSRAARHPSMCDERRSFRRSSSSNRASRFT